jgi:flagellar biosynthesis protein FliR
MATNTLEIWLSSCLLLSLRITPVFLFAPPFMLVRVPRLFVTLTGMGLSALIVSGWPAIARVQSVTIETLFIGGARELMLGLVPVVILNQVFGALYLAGRTIDVQAGFGLAMLIDPTTKGQVPLAGTLFAYCAAVTFFAMDGHAHLLRFFILSLEQIPLATANAFASLSQLTSFILATTLLAMGVGGAAILALFLTDIVVALLARTVPQMNALLLGIQVKAIIFLAVLPIAIGTAGALFVQLVVNGIATMPKLL